jgi:hypothetical protein
MEFFVARIYTTYHTIFDIWELAKFMTVPHYVYHVLNMPAPRGFLSVRGDVQATYDCDKKSVYYLAATLHLTSKAKSTA